MTAAYLIGLDFGTASARGVLIDLASNLQIEHAVCEYASGVLAHCLPNSSPLPPGSALFDPEDYLVAAEQILATLGRDRHIVAIGIASTASSPLPTTHDGSSLVESLPDDPHSYVKLWKHALAQPFAEQINSRRAVGSGDPAIRISGEGLLAKAAEVKALSPTVWTRAEKYIEAGDWIVWQLTGRESRSMDFACFKAMYSRENGYPAAVVDGLGPKLSEPIDVGRVAGHLSPTWRAKTSIKGTPVVSVACIDSHATLPAVGVTSASTLVGALGTSSGFLTLAPQTRPVPVGFEGAAFGAALPDIWCCEAGQAAFGDVLGWFIRTFPHVGRSKDKFKWYNFQAEHLEPGGSGLLALDWFGGSRVPYADSSLSGLLVGLRIGTTAVEIYRALVESLAFGIRSIVERGELGGLVLSRILLTSNVARSNGFLVQTICDVLGRAVEVPEIDHATALGSAIHGAVAAGVVEDFEEGAMRFGCQRFTPFKPNLSISSRYSALYDGYLALSSDEEVIKTMRKIGLATKSVALR